MEITGTCFELRQWLSGDAPSLQKHGDNKKIADVLFDSFPHPYTIAEAHQWIQRHLNQQPLTNFVISVNGAAVGAIEFKPGKDLYRKNAILGYWLGEQFWGRGIMTEAVGLVTNHVFANFDIARIQATVNGNNPASMRVLEKAGFKKEAVLRNAIIKNGVVMDEHLYALLKL